jgi:hypothetical protein
MIISWYTDPSQGTFKVNDPKEGRFSSYYQYDTVSRKFVRIRLELGRKASGGDTGATQVILKKERAVGFSQECLINTDKVRIDGNGIRVNGKLLSQTPNKGDYVIDMSPDSPRPHLGNPVIKAPNWPAGIETKHLSVLANQAVINGKGYGLTNSTKTREDLSKAIEKSVSKIFDKPFDQITDVDLLTKLKAQVTTIREQSTQTSEETVNSSLNDVNELIEQINAAIGDGTFTPNATVENAFDSLKEAVANVNNALDTPTRTAAIDDLEAAHDALVTAFEQDAAQQLDTYQENLENASRAIDTARQASQRIDAIHTEYESAEQAETIDEYEESMEGVEEV